MIDELRRVIRRMHYPLEVRFCRNKRTLVSSADEV